MDEILVEGEAAYNQAKDLMQMLMPSHVKDVKLYQESVSISHYYGVEAQLDQLFQPNVSLPSGGYIVINLTEALVAIDVNSGRSTKETSIEETATKTNLEAAEEIARQMRLRDLAGLIVIDFIDMTDNQNIRLVERKVKDCLRNDRARLQIGNISSFGLMELSRQRLRPSIIESSSKACPHCLGSGFIRGTESISLHIIRAVEEEVMKEQGSKIILSLPNTVALYILNDKRSTLIDLENRYAATITVNIDYSMTIPDFRIEKQAAIADAAVPVKTAVHGGMVEWEEINDSKQNGETKLDKPVSKNNNLESQDKNNPARRGQRNYRRLRTDDQANPERINNTNQGKETERAVQNVHSANNIDTKPKKRGFWAFLTRKRDE